MRHRGVGDPMPPTAVSVRPDTTFKEIARFLDEYDITAVPVVDADGRVAGVVRRNALLQALIRDDAGIGKENGVVELTGRMPEAAMSRVVAEVEYIDDVVEVNDHLTTV